MSELIERVQVLRGHTSPDTVLVVDDYPYGYTLRCKIRYWIETATRGQAKGQQRFVSQTTNPKREGEVWNAPKASTYSMFVFMYRNADDHVKHFTISKYSVTPEGDARVRLRGIYDQMLPEEREMYDEVVALSKLYPDPWDGFEEVVTRMVDQLRRNDPPDIDGLNWYDPVEGRRRYLGDTDAHLATALGRYGREG